MDFTKNNLPEGQVGLWPLVFTSENRLFLRILKFLNLQAYNFFFDIILFIILSMIFMTIYIDWFDLEASLDDLLDTILVYL